MPLAALEAVKEPLGKVARVLMEICSYAGQQWVVLTEHTHTHLLSSSPLYTLSMFGRWARSRNLSSDGSH